MVSARRSNKRRVVVSLPMKKKKTPQKKQEQEMTRLGSALRMMGGLGGGALGGMVGYAGMGSELGKGLGASLSRWLGSGDYQVSNNSILKMSNQVPSMHKAGDGIVVRHREFIGDITSSGSAFTRGVGVRLNPGDAHFPWLRAIALNFTQYRWKGLVFHYVTTSGNSVGSTTTSLGTVMMATHYDTAQQVPASKLELLNEYYSNDAKPSENFCHPIECKASQSVTDLKYITAHPNTNFSDARFEDHGLTYVFTQGQQAGCTVGEVWATYEVELLKPKAVSTRGDSIAASGYMMGVVVNTAWLGTISYSSANVPKEYNDHIVTRIDNNTLQFGQVSPGTYEVRFEIQAATALSPPTVAFTNATTLNAYGNGTSCSQINAITGATAGWLTISWMVNVPALEDVTIAFTSGSGVVTAANYGVIWLQQVSGSLIYA